MSVLEFLLAWLACLGWALAAIWFLAAMDAFAACKRALDGWGRAEADADAALAGWRTASDGWQRALDLLERRTS